MTKIGGSGPKRPAKLIRLHPNLKTFPASSISTKIKKLKTSWATLSKIDDKKFPPKGFIPLRVLTDNFQGIPSLEAALEKYQHSYEFHEDRLWLDQLDILKDLLSREPNLVLTYRHLRQLNKMVQEIALLSGTKRKD